MDKLVDHLFVLEGEGKIKDFPVPPVTAASPSSTTTTSKKLTMVTPQSPHHQLFPVKDSTQQEDMTTRSSIRGYTRGSSGGGQTFHLSSALAWYLTESRGSAKTNIVYAGHAHTDNE